MLLGSTVLDVAIGLVFIYLIVSLICSALNEGIEAQLKNRSKDLERGIFEMLSSAPNATPAGPGQPANLVQALYDHPLISCLFKGDYASAKQNKELPSYIPSKNFALALLDTVRRAAATGADGTLTIAQLRAAAVKFAEVNPKVSGALVALIDAAGNDLNRARLNIENWFDSSMDRVSGWYKRRAQYFIFSFGMAIAIAGNIDSIDIVRVLSTDGGVREALVAQAGAFAKPSQAQSPGATPATPSQPNTVPAVSNGDLANTIKQLRQAGLPIGWGSDYGGTPVDVNGWAMKVLGIILTGLAVSLGAPFWFDLLNRFIVVRSTVKPTEKSQPEKPKD